MTRILLMLAASFALAMPVNADSRTQLLRLLKHELRHYTKVSPETLSTSQLSQIYSTIHGFGTEGEKRLHIRSIIGGSNTLRGALGLGRSY